MPGPPQSPNTFWMPCAAYTPPTANRRRSRPKSVAGFHVSSRRFGWSRGWVVAEPSPDPPVAPYPDPGPGPVLNSEVGWSLIALPGYAASALGDPRRADGLVGSSLIERSVVPGTSPVINDPPVRRSLVPIDDQVRRVHAA